MTIDNRSIVFGFIFLCLSLFSSCNSKEETIQITEADKAKFIEEFKDEIRKQIDMDCESYLYPPDIIVESLKDTLSLNDEFYKARVYLSEASPSFHEILGVEDLTQYI